MMKDELTALFYKFAVLVWVFLSPIHTILFGVGLLVVLDMFTGVLASIKEKKPITSDKLRISVIKSLAYMSAVLVAFLIETLIFDGIPIIKTVSALIAITEGQSFFENLKRITGVDFWSAILKKLHGGTVFLPKEKKGDEIPKS